jgi:DNA polymerase-4
MEAPLPFIVHIDADAFFVGCEQARRPELRGKKCAVGGTERGIISSASYEARACGVYTPMPTSQALRMCPDLIMIPHTNGLYGQVSDAMFDLCESITPWVQRNSIDEGYLDLAPCGLKTTTEVEYLVRGLQQRIWDELQITVSMGIAANKLVAQIASKLRKPEGFVVVPVGAERDFLAPLSIGKLPGIGAKTEASLAEFGLKLIGDVFGRNERELKTAFGSDWAAVVAMARGKDDRPVETIPPEAKSYSQQETFAEDVGEFSKIERVAKRMIDELLAKVRTDGKRVRTITVRVRYGDFTQTSQGKSLVEASDLEAPFYPLLGSLLSEVWNQRRKLRLVSVRFSGVEESGTQLEMFTQGDEKRRKLAAVLDRLNLGGTSAGVSRGHQLGGTKRN